MSESHIEHLESIDWECEKEDTRYLTHDFHPYSSKYIPQISRNLLSFFTEKGETVLDPFVGSGTTLAECKLLGRNGIGIDINPLACLISKVKSTPISPEKLEQEAQDLLERIEGSIAHVRELPRLFSYSDQRGNPTTEASVVAPNFPYIQSWFQPPVIKELAIIKKQIDSMNNGDLHDFFLVAFSSILRPVSNAASGFGNLMISKKPPKKRFIYERFRAKLKGMLPRMAEFYRRADNSCYTAVMLGDARKLDFVSSESVDMICTHPPYMASVPYAEYQKLSLWWLGYDPNTLDAELIGGQRSRDDTPERYIGDMRNCFQEMYRVAKSGCCCCVVIGNPVYRGRLWPLNDLFKEIAIDAGFKFIHQIVRGKYRMTMGKMKREFILIFQK